MIELYYAEDDPDIARNVKEYLEQKGLKVTIYNTLAQIRQALKIHVPTIVLLDWNMPDGHGMPCVNGFEADGRNYPLFFLRSAEIPVILWPDFITVRMIM